MGGQHHRDDQGPALGSSVMGYAAQASASRGEGPLVSEIDVWRTAAQMIKGYSDTADIEAAARADALLAKGDVEGQRVWLRIAKAIDELQKVLGPFFANRKPVDDSFALPLA